MTQHTCIFLQGGVLSFSALGYLVCQSRGDVHEEF